jgi:ABC-2 type transport system ATP-binding protein
MAEFGAEDLTKSYADVRALDGVSVSLATGEVHCLAGPNGSGKSTVFRILLGLTRPDSGTVTRPARSLVGAGFQEPAFYDSLTVAENVDTFGRLSGTPGEAWVDRVVDVFELEQMWTRRAGDLSGGFAKQLDLALALLKRPTYVLLDEPLADLDDVSTGSLLGFLDDYAESGNAVVLSSHRIEEIGPVVDRLTVMRDGTVRRRVRDTSENESIAEIYRDAVERD